MSNISPNPRFVPTPGKPTAAPPMDLFGPIGRRWCYYANHRTMAQVMADEERQARKSAPAKFTHCWGCVARAVCPFPQDCPRCREMAA